MLSAAVSSATLSLQPDGLLVTDVLWDKERVMLIKQGVDNVGSLSVRLYIVALGWREAQRSGGARV